MHTRIVASAAIALALAACAAPSVPSDADRVAAGTAQLYVLRPALSELGRRDTPMLLVNDREAVTLEYRSFSAFTLQPGAHRLAVRPGHAQSVIWNGEWSLTVQAQQRYFVAIWSDVERTAEVKALPAAPLPAAASPGRESVLRYQVISEEDALPLMRTLTSLRPLSASFAPLPP